MQDEFDDNGLGLPDDDDVAGGDLTDLGIGTDGDLDFGLDDEDEAEDAPAGRPSGGARAAVRRLPVTAPSRHSSRGASAVKAVAAAGGKNGKKKKTAATKAKAAPKRKAKVVSRAAPKKKARAAKKRPKKATRKAGRKRARR